MNSASRLYEECEAFVWYFYFKKQQGMDDKWHLLIELWLWSEFPSDPLLYNVKKIS